MEYVHGIPITEYCAKHRLTIKERLELFIHVCEGVQHAHQKGQQWRRDRSWRLLPHHGKGG
jgi:serine/threonine protein kinase